MGRVLSEQIFLSSYRCARWCEVSADTSGLWRRYFDEKTQGTVCLPLAIAERLGYLASGPSSETAMNYEKSGPVEENWRDAISSIEDIIDDARNGRMFILVDHEDRENEGDLVIPAQMATPDAINFMATHGRGLICLTLTAERIEALGLPLMASNNSSRHETAFTTSIEAREGVTTGISAHDRAHTVAVAIDASKTEADIATPGHVFPLRARQGGVLVRAGHTEAAVDISRLAGLNPSGVICEIMNEDGTMARLPDLVSFAQKHGLKIGTISDLISYRRRHDNLVRQTEARTVQSPFGGPILPTTSSLTVARKNESGSIGSCFFIR